MDKNDDILNKVRTFADILCDDGRGIKGTASPLFPGQLNVYTYAVPTGLPDDPGAFSGNAEIAGCGPNFSNLLFELGLLDTLKLLTQLTGNEKYKSAGEGHLRHLFEHCSYPGSGYIPWGEHVGYDAIQKKIIRGEYKGMHEVKGNMIPWEDFWRISPETVKNEIGVAFRNHICDEASFSFNRHAPMDGTSNAYTGASPCSIADSGGTYLYGWVWLYKKTGDRKYLDWARKMEAHFWNKRFPVTGLFCTAEDRPDECWYADALAFAVFLLASYDLAGDEWNELKEHGLAYFKSYYKIAYSSAKNGFFDTFNVATGEQVFGLSRHIPAKLPAGYESDYIKAYTRPDLLTAWEGIENSSKIVSVATSTAAGIVYQQDEMMLELFDMAVGLLAIEDTVARNRPLKAGDGAGVILSLLHVFQKTGNDSYMKKAGLLTQYMLETACRNGVFTTGIEGFNDYYAIRAGSGDLAAAVLGYWIAVTGNKAGLPPIRDLYGIMPW